MRRNTKSISIKSRRCRSSGHALKVVELTLGDLGCVSDPRLRLSQGCSTATQKSAEGKVRSVPAPGLESGTSVIGEPRVIEAVARRKARTVPSLEGLNSVASKERNF